MSDTDNTETPNQDEAILDEDSPSEDLAEEAQEEAETEPILTPEEALQFELAEAKDQALRSRADFDNYRKRMAREMERVRKIAAETLIHDILPAIDNLDLALQHAGSESNALSQGVEMVFKQLQDVLGNHGLTPIEALGQTFDPNIHEAVSQVASDDIEKDNIVQVFQSGYKLGDMILRPAKVVISTGPDVPAEESTDESTPEKSATTE